LISLVPEGLEEGFFIHVGAIEGCRGVFFIFIFLKTNKWMLKGKHTRFWKEGRMWEN